MLSAKILLCSTLVLAALLHLQTVMDLWHLVDFPFLQHFLHFRVIFCVCGIQCWVIICQNPIIAFSKLPFNDIFVQRLICSFWRPQADNISAKGKTGLNSETTWYETESAALVRFAYVECVSSCWWHQLVMSGIQNLRLIFTASGW